MVCALQTLESSRCCFVIQNCNDHSGSIYSTLCGLGLSDHLVLMHKDQYMVARKYRKSLIAVHCTYTCDHKIVQCARVFPFCFFFVVVVVAFVSSCITCNERRYRHHVL